MGRLDRLMRQRERFMPSFRAARDALTARFGSQQIDDWAEGVLDLANVNAGPACLLAFWKASAEQSADDGLAPLIVAAHASATICRSAGARAATACIMAFTTAQRMLPTSEALNRWWRAMDDIARQAPESIDSVASRIGEIILGGNLDAFESFIAAGLKVSSGNRTRRLAFFSLQDPLARRLIERSSAGIGFAETERQTKAFVTSLWGRPPLLRRLPVPPGQSIQRRSAIAGPLLRLPDFYRGVDGDAAYSLYRAAAAHAQAHIVFGGPPFPVGQLKPLQVALGTLIEDARVETLAMREFPGLQRLWSPYHLAAPTGVATAPALLARLARALFDPAYVDDNGFVAKGRHMFEAAMPRVGERVISREIGMLLGNDLGQMRVQFNAKAYVVEPFYRDDGLGLWDLGENAPRSDESLELIVDVVRPEQQHAPDSSEIPPDAATDAAAAHAQPVAPDERGIVIATYPEWDRVHGIDRPEWTTVREVIARPGDPRGIEDALERADVLRHRVRQLVRGMRIGRTVRLKRQPDGHDLDIDAIIEAGVSLRLDQEPDYRVFRSSHATHRDLAVLLLIDISESTRDRLPSGTSILDVERLAVAVLSETMHTLGDPFCLLAFASNGKEDVEITSVKTFDETYDRACIGRLAGLSSGLSTRLGTALRHAGAVLTPARSFRKLVIVLTDGEPSDIDVADPLDLVEDARRAAAGLKSRGIDGFGVVLDPGGIGAAARIFGRGNTMLVHRVDDLPRSLSELYFRLARR